MPFGKQKFFAILDCYLVIILKWCAYIRI